MNSFTSSLYKHLGRFDHAFLYRKSVNERKQRVKLSLCMLHRILEVIEEDPKLKENEASRVGLERAKQSQPHFLLLKQRSNRIGAYWFLAIQCNLSVRY
jgi:hypothetical protein